MAGLLDQPLGELLDVPTAATAGPVRPEVAAFVARVATLAFTTASVAPPGATARALAANSPQSLLGAFADLLTVGHPASPDPLADSFARGRRALAAALEASGGVWRADEAQQRLQVTRTTLLQWRNAGRVLALRLAGGFVYPAAQFAPAATDLEPPRPYPAVADVLAAAGDRLTPEELAGLLATPQPGLARATGPEAARPRTGFQAVAESDGALVVALVRHVVRSPDAEAQADVPEDVSKKTRGDGGSAEDAPRAAA